jgi:HlyD family secretion protein
LTLTLVTAATAALSGCAKPAPAKAIQAPLTLSTATVTMRPLSGGLTASGNLVSREEAGVSSELAGYRISQVFADEGDWVKQGQPLVRLDDTLPAGAAGGGPG